MTTSKQLANQAASWRRAATTLRNMAEWTEISTADRVALLKAASIVEREATGATDASISKKAAEKKLERDIAAGKALAQPIVMALPMSSTAEKLACMPAHSRAHLDGLITGGHEPSRMLQAFLEDDLRELIFTMAINHAKGRSPVNAQADELRRQHAALVQHPEITQLAARIDAAIAQSQQQQ